MKKIILFSLLWLCICLTSCHEPSVYYKQTEDINKIHDYYLYVYGNVFTEEKNDSVLPNNLKYEYTNELNIEVVVFPTAIIVNCAVTYELAEELNLLLEKGITIIFFNSSAKDNEIIFSKQFNFYEYNSIPEGEYFNIYFDPVKNKSYATSSRGTVIGLLYMVEEWLSFYK